jgi:hypothetical protein
LNPRPHEAQLEDQKPRKAKEDHLEEGKTIKPKNGKRKKKQRKAQLNPPPPETNSP